MPWNLPGLAPFVALPNVEAMASLGVRAAFTAVDGAIRQFYPAVVWPTTAGTPVIEGAKGGGLALRLDNTAYAQWTGLHDYVDASSASNPITIIARFERIGPHTEFDVWSTWLSLSHGSTNLMSLVRAYNISDVQFYINAGAADTFTSFLASERTDTVLVLQTYGSSGNTLAGFIDGEPINSPYTTGSTRTTGSTDLRFGVNTQASAGDNGSMTFRDAFILNRQLSAEEVRALSQPGALWQLYEDTSDFDDYLPTPSAPPSGGFLAAWAAQRSRVIGAGAY